MSERMIPRQGGIFPDSYGCDLESGPEKKEEYPVTPCPVKNDGFRKGYLVSADGNVVVGV